MRGGKGLIDGGKKLLLRENGFVIYRPVTCPRYTQAACSSRAGGANFLVEKGTLP